LLEARGFDAPWVHFLIYAWDSQGQMETGMALHCAHCSHPIIIAAGQRLPPWCPACGADLKFPRAGGGPQESKPAQAHADEAKPAAPAALVHPAAPAPARELTPRPVAARALAAEGCCPGCGAGIEFTDWSDGVVSYCADCGQCLKAPAPWSPACGERRAVRPTCMAPSNGKRIPGRTGIIIGVVIAGLPWAIAVVPFTLQVAATLLGAALIVEGIAAPRRPAASLEIPQELAEAGDALGSLQAIYRTANRCSDSLAIVLVALSCAAGEIGILDWIREEPHAKLFICGLILPVMAAYLLYRAGRNLRYRADVLVFQHGLVYVRSGRAVLYPWEKIESIKHKEIGDAIDEQAVEIRLKYGQALLRFTCSHFPNLAHFRAQLERAFHGRPGQAEPADSDLFESANPASI
jgi:uncharacterized protein (DUF983 family)